MFPFSSLSKEKWLIFYSKKKVLYEKGIYFYEKRHLQSFHFCIFFFFCFCCFLLFYYVFPFTTFSLLSLSHSHLIHFPTIDFPIFTSFLRFLKLVVVAHFFFYATLLCSLHCRLSVLHSISY